MNMIMDMFDINNIRKICESGKIKWSKHASEQILRREISREDVLTAIKRGEIIEEYPSNWPHPACLVYGQTLLDVVIHIVVGIEEYIHIITVYHPDTDKFKDDLKTRRDL